MRQVLVVEDDQTLAMALRDGFQFEGYSVLVSNDGGEAVPLAIANQLDLIVLDVMLPNKSGLEICSELRKAGNSVPIIILSVRSEEHVKVLGLKLGADDYLIKPFGFIELLARAEAIFRRTGRRETSNYFRCGDLQIDVGRGEVTKGGVCLDLSSKERQMMKLFVDRCGQVITRDELLNNVWGYDRFPFTRTVDVHVAKLRRKIEDDPSHPKHLITVHGSGYKLSCALTTT